MKVNLSTIKQYCELVVGGVPKRAAAKEVFGTPNAVAKVENNEDFKIIYAAFKDRHALALTREVQELQLQKIRAYSRLLASTEEAIDSAETLEEKMQAQESQRRNLNLQVIEHSEHWNSADRNKEKVDALDGIILE